MLSCPRIMAKKTLVVGKCPLTLDHKNNSFKVSFVVVDSVPIYKTFTTYKKNMQN